MLTTIVTVHFDKFSSDYSGRQKLNLPVMVDNWTKQMSTLHTLLRHHSTQPELATQDRKHSVLGTKDAAYLGDFVGENAKKQHQYYNTASNFSKSVNTIIDQMETDISTIRNQLDTCQSPPSSRYNNFTLTKSSPKKKAPFPTLNNTAVTVDNKQLLPFINEEDVIVNIRRSVRDTIRKPKTLKLQEIPNPTQYMMQTPSLPSPVAPKENIKLSFLERIYQ